MPAWSEWETELEDHVAAWRGQESDSEGGRVGVAMLAGV